jgi:beta-lactamase class A
MIRLRLDSVVSEMREIITSVQQSRGGRRAGRHTAVPAWRARLPRLRLLALVPLALVASLVAANVLVGHHRARTSGGSGLLVTVSPSAVPATRPPEDRVARAAPRTPAPATTAAFSTTRNGVGCAGPGTTAARALALRVQNRVGSALRAVTGARVAFAAEDSVTGVRCSIRSTTHYDSASIVKAAIVSALLVKRHDAHRSLSKGERTLARAAITRSDNGAASALWRAVGGTTGMRHFFARAGMKRTVAGSGGYWGLTQVTAGDELTLLRKITRAGLLVTADRRYLQGLMASVIREQRWGVPTGAPAGARAGNKNGWLLRTTKAWRVHSIGWVQLRTTTYDVVLLSDGSRSLTSGTRRLDTLARAVNAALGAGRS